MRPMGRHGMMGTSLEDLKGASIDRQVMIRAWRFARPFRGWIFLFLGAIVVSSVLALVPPLLFRTIIDDAIPNGNGRTVTIVASLMVAVALLDAALNLLN